MKALLAEIVMLSVNLLCALTGHAFGCAAWRLLWRPYCWAADVTVRERDYPERHDCPVCAKARRVAGEAVGGEWQVVDTSRTASAAGTVVLHLKPRDAA